MHDDLCTFLSYPTQFLLEREMFHTKVVEKNQNTHFMLGTFSTKIVTFMRRCGKNTVYPDSRTLQYNTAHALCMPDN
jgi:hypothetical protein